MERTLAIIKPDAIALKYAGNILRMIELADFNILAMRLFKLDKLQAQGFYYVHKDKPFFKDLITFMTSGPIIVMVIESPDGVAKWRKLMGETDPKKASDGTVRKLYGTNIERNAVHGSDSLENAHSEIHYFFSAIELI
jgi:nucleoside-diphosphate kinase